MKKGLAIGLAVLAVLAMMALSSCGGGGGGGLVPLPPATVLSEFVGSESCQSCHTAIYSKWINSSGHKYKVQPATLSNVINDSDGDGENDFQEGITVGSPGGVGTATWHQVVAGKWTDYVAAGTAPVLSYNAIDETFFITIGAITYTVDFVLGGQFWKQRYVTKLGNSYYILPVHYNMVQEGMEHVDANAYSEYKPGNWYDTGTFQPLYAAGQTPLTEGNTDDSWQRRCAACHSTGVMDTTLASNGEYIAEYKELGAACESCHGSGKNHIEHSGGPGTITNPADLAVDRGNDVCRACHNRGSSVHTFSNGKTNGFPWGVASTDYFKPGDDLGDFFNETPNGSSGFWQDRNYSEKKHREQGIGHSRSHHLEKGVMCWDCHDPHGSDYSQSLKFEGDQLCLQCHDETDLSGGSAASHKQGGDPAIHLANALTCSDCHYVRTGKSAYAYDIHAHHSEVIYPEETDIVGVPNSCGTGNCHSGGTTGAAWASNDAATTAIATRWGDNLDANNNMAPYAFLYADGHDTGFSMATTPVITLTGTSSFDPDATDLVGMIYSINNATSLLGGAFVDGGAGTATFTPLVPGTYTFELIVTDAEGEASKPNTLTITVTP